MSESWLGGGSASGLACGIAAALVIAFEMLLWPRKYLRRLRLIPARHWMAAHIWLGIASLPLAIFHCGFHLGGTLPSLFMVLFVLTILSGVYGLVLQNVLPKLLLRVLPAETIYSEIDHVSQQNIRDLRQTITATCGARTRANEVLENEPAVPTRSTVVVGAMREVGMVRGRTLRTQTIISSDEDREILWNAFEEIEPFLAKGEHGSKLFKNPGAAVRWFADLRRTCSDNSEAAIASMEQCFAQRQQFDLQRRLHHWLHAWLPVHIGLSVAVSVLLVVHIFTALRYW